MTTADAASRIGVATMRGAIVWALASLLGIACAGCYLAHERPSDAAVAVDHDAAAPVCNRLAFGPAVLLEASNGVTPRLVALDDGGVGVVYVVPGAGDPTEVWFERLDASLARVAGPTLLVRNASTWREVVRTPSGLVVGYGTSPRGVPSEALAFDLDGVAVGVRLPVALQNPAVLRASADGLFWLAMEMHDQNAFVVAHVAADGSLLHDPQRIDLGRYGSGFGVATRPDGRGEVLAYPSEGPSGVRRARVRAVAMDGALSSEHTLSTDGADAALPVFVDEALEVVYRTDSELRVATLDPASLETRAERALGRLDGTTFAARIGQRLVVGALGSGRITALDATSPGALPISASTPLAGTSGALDWVEVPGGLVLAAGLVSGPTSVPWIVRIDCVP